MGPGRVRQDLGYASKIGGFILLVMSLASCSFKGGMYSFTDEGYKGYGNRSIAEFDISTPRAYDKVDLEFAAAFVRINQEGEIGTVQSGSNGRLIYLDKPEFELNLKYYLLTMRYYPLGSGKITPAIGAGMGYYDYYYLNRGPGGVTVCPTASGTIDDKLCLEVETDTHTIESGFRPHVMAGLYVRIWESDRKDNDSEWVFIIEDRYGFLNLNPDGKTDLSGNQFLVGIGLRWK